VLSALLAARAYAAPDPAALVRSALPPGFASSSALWEPPLIRIPSPVMVRAQAAGGDTPTVALPALLDRHLYKTDSFAGAAGTTLVAGTLDGKGDGYLAVTTPGGVPRFIKIERGMSAVWSDGVHQYRATLSVNIFRPRLNNFLQIRNVKTGKYVWEKRINELFGLAYKAGEPVTLAGRPYRLFYSARPELGLCFIYDDMSTGVHDYKFYMVPFGQLTGPAPASYQMFGGDVIKLRVTADHSALDITR
jgi:hypothetical protein